MRRTFRPGDYLHIEQVQLVDIRSGDIIVFRDLNNSKNPEDEKEMVHRVIKVIPEHLITRGDNNFFIDNTLVNENNLMGKVVRFERNSKIHPIWGGYRGLFKAQILHVFLLKVRIIKKILRPLYRGLRKSGLISKIWHPDIEKIYFNTEKGPLVKYICGDRTVARFWPESGSFECRKPYDLILIKQLKT